MRKDVYEGVKSYVNQTIKPNYAELGRQYETDHCTVKSDFERVKKHKQTSTNNSCIKKKVAN